jgi:UDP-N-acetylmuramate--alanine ligase
VLTESLRAGEAPIAGADAKSLARAIRSRGRIDPVLVNGAKDLPACWPDVLHDGDLLLSWVPATSARWPAEIAAKDFEGASKP